MHTYSSGLFLQYLLLYIQHVTVSNNKSLELAKLNMSFLPHQYALKAKGLAGKCSCKSKPIFFKYRDILNVEERKSQFAQ